MATIRGFFNSKTPIDLFGVIVMVNLTQFLDTQSDNQNLNKTKISPFIFYSQLFVNIKAEVNEMKKNTGIILIVILSIFVLMGLAMWYFGPRTWPDTDYPYYGHMIGGWGMPFGMLGMGIFWIAVLYFIFKGYGHREACRHSDAIETLKNRLARGEITIEEYEKLIEKFKGCN